MTSLLPRGAQRNGGGGAAQNAVTEGALGGATYASDFSAAPSSSTASAVVAHEHMKRTLPSMKR